jgi:magnesium chelatase family protein
MLATISSATLSGIDGVSVTVEVHVANGLPGFTVVGLPDTSCREARDRVRAALLTTGFEWPDRRTTVNLAPTSIRKIGAGLDLAIAIGVLVASEQLPPEVVAGRAFIGELGLDGTLRHVPGTLSLVDACADPEVVVPPGSHSEASLVSHRDVRCAPDIRELVDALTAEAPWPRPPDEPIGSETASVPDLSDVRGHQLARLAIEVAAAGGHHLLMVGPPGSGKTMLAERLPGLLPELDDATAFEATRVQSAAGLAAIDGLVRRPPWRAPHHGTSAVAMVGGGGHRLRPGEISLAHGGVRRTPLTGRLARWWAPMLGSTPGSQQMTGGRWASPDRRRIAGSWPPSWEPRWLRSSATTTSQPRTQRSPTPAPATWPCSTLSVAATLTSSWLRRVPD